MMKSIQTTSVNIPYDIVGTRSWDLAYTENNDRTLNLVRNELIETVIRLRGWRSLELCSTYSDYLLVIIESDDYKQTKFCVTTAPQKNK